MVDVKEGTIGNSFINYKLEYMERVNSMQLQLALQQCQRNKCNNKLIRKTVNKDTAIEIWHLLGDGLWNLREVKK